LSRFSRPGERAATNLFPLWGPRQLVPHVYSKKALEAETTQKLELGAIRVKTMTLRLNRTADHNIQMEYSGSRDENFQHLIGNPDFLMSLARGLRVIEAFEGRTAGASPAEISRHTQLSRAAVRRILVTLEMLGYAESHGRVYRLTSRVMRLGFSYLSSSSLSSLAQPILERVIERVHESSSLGVLESDEVVYVARATAKRVMSIGLSVGSRFPAYCTSMGRVLLSGLPEQELTAYLNRTELKRLTSKTIVDKGMLADVIRRVRLQGFAINNEELELGHRSISVPVLDRRGRMVAGMNMGVHAARVSVVEMKNRLLPILREHSALLGQLLG
jgi:IclR family pca regulon transcriptional regulator